MQISVVAYTKQLTKHLNRIQKKQIPFATSKALNSVAFDAQSFIKKSLPRRLDRPTGDPSKGKGGIIGSVQVQQSKKKNLVARVGFAGLGFRSTKWKESPAEIMRRHIQGGTRSPQGKAIPVPIAGNLKLNKFGNMPRTKIKTLLAKPDKYFSGQPKGRDAGIYERIKRTKRKPGKLKMLISWEPRTQYQGGRFPLKKIVELAVKNKYRKRFDAALKYALR